MKQNSRIMRLTGKFHGLVQRHADDPAYAETLLREGIDTMLAISAARAPCIGAIFTTMSVEPGVVDTNVLVYAFDADATQHVPAQALLEPGRP